jgi:hypothetical protein
MFNPPVGGHRGSYYEGQFTSDLTSQYPGSLVPGINPNVSTGTLPINVPIENPPSQKDKERDREKSEKKHRHRDHSERERERSHKDRENRDKDGHTKERSHREKKKKSTKDKIIPPEEDIRRLFQECKIGMGNASLLSQAVGHTKPEELDLDADGKDVISVSGIYLASM